MTENEYEEEFEREDEDEEEDSDSFITQAYYYLHQTMHDFFKKILSNIDDLHLSPEDLVVVSKMHLLTEDPKKYKVDVYASTMVKERIDEDNFTFLEIKF